MWSTNLGIGSHNDANMRMNDRYLESLSLAVLELR